MKIITRHFIFSACLLLSMLSVQAQCKIELKVFDEQQKPLDGTFARLLRSKDSSLVKYTMSTSEGAIAFENIKQGNYLIYISQTGFKNYYSSAIVLDSIHNVITLPPVILQTNLLKEVSIVSSIPVIQRYADRTVVNVQQSILTAASNIFDVIQRSPGIKVDQGDNISMVGKQGVSVMIDGKMTSISGTDLANMLRSISADAVDKIEFITNPSAKYDANGTAGIINIILKKDKRIGTNATVSAGYGQGVYSKTNEGFSLSRRAKKFNLFMNYNYSYSKNFHNAPRTRNFYKDDVFTGGYSETDYHTVPLNSHTARMGCDFFASKNTTIGFIADGMDRRYIASGNTNVNIFDSINNPLSYNITNSDVEGHNYNYSGNFNLNHKFDSLGREILINLDYADFTSHTTQSFFTNYYDLNNNIVSAPYQLFGDVPGQLNIYSFKADYDGKFGRHGSLEAGVKSSYVKTDNNLKFYDGSNTSAPLDTGQSNHFIYSENINAGYVSYSRDLKKADIKIGLRAEQTIADGDQVTTNQLLHINSFKFFPNVDINDSISKSSQLGFSFSRRLDRPTYQQLNPFRNYVDPSTYSEGNPLLLPQYSYVFQATETYKENYSISFNYTRTKGVISSVWLPIAGALEPIIAERQVNLNYNDYYGTNASVISKITDWWTSTNMADAYYTHYNANYQQANLNTTKFYWDVNSDNLFTFKNKISLDINASYNSGWDDGYLLQKSSENISVGLQKKIFKNKGTIKINATDIFYTSNGRGTATFTGYVENYYIKRDTRVVSFAFNYRFGNSQSRAARNKGGAEDEKKRAGSSS